MNGKYEAVVEVSATGQDIQGLKNYPTDNEKPNYLICEDDGLTRPVCSVPRLWGAIKSADSDSSTAILGRDPRWAGAAAFSSNAPKASVAYQSE